MKLKKLTLLSIISLSVGLSANAQDAITWSTYRNGSKVADTVALGDYLPLKDNEVYVEAIVDLPGVSKAEMFSRAKIAIQKTFTSNKMGTSNYDPEAGICSVNNFYDIIDMTALSALGSNPSTD